MGDGACGGSHEEAAVRAWYEHLPHVLAHLADVVGHGHVDSLGRHRLRRRKEVGISVVGDGIGQRDAVREDEGARLRPCEVGEQRVLRRDARGQARAGRDGDEEAARDAPLVNEADAEGGDLGGGDEDCAGKADKGGTGPQSH